MELLALVLFNLAFGVVLYFLISIKVTNSFRDYQIVKLKKEIQTHTLNFFKESESYLALMDSKITVFKNLLEKAETMGIDLDAKESIPKIESPTPIDKKESVPIASKELLQKFTVERERILKSAPPTPESNLPDSTKQEQETESSGFLGGVGRIFRSILGIPDQMERTEEMRVTSIPNFQTQPPKKTIDFSVGGNPLMENPPIQLDSSPPTQFRDLLENKKPSPKDKITISTKSALSELPPGTPKVEKVVHLLKKGFSHIEISEELGLAIPEISLIETIKIERNRRI